MTSMSEQYLENTREAQAKWVEATKSVLDEAKRAFDGETLAVDPAVAGERWQQGIDQVFDFWTRVVEFNRDVAKRVADANLEYLNVLQRQAEAAGGQALARFEEARVRAAQVADQTQSALAKSASELENAGNIVAEKTARQFEKNVDTAADQTVAMSQRVGDQAEKAAAEGEDVAESARKETRQAGARARKAADTDK
ncbi:hypothetical protein [Granulicoccus sp. GXG6511]|uniref:hypothetical protein n=1 Tax=Granulicoccus sp. GXG6511 TaxID=3381351 RepID=UPI003D7D20BF